MKIKYSITSLLLVYFILSLTTFSWWTQSGLNTVTGDEPHYLVMASGIGKYGSLEQTLPYKEEFLTNKIYKNGLEVQGVAGLFGNTHVVQGPHGLFNIHNIGLPLLVAIPFILGGVVGAKLFMILCGAIVVILAWKISKIFSEDRKERYWSTFAACISIPLIPASNQIYPDILAGLISLSGLYWLLTTQKTRTVATELIWAGALVFLPWLQIKFSATCALLVLAITTKIFIESGNHKRIVRILLVFFISCIALAIYNAYAFGKVSGPYQSGELEISKTSLMVLLGLHLDQNQGFLLQNPVGFVGVIAVGGLYRYSKKFALVWGLIFLSLIVPNAMHPIWYGGGSFSGRFGWSAAIVFLLPVIYGLLCLASRQKKTFRLIIFLCILLQAYFFSRYVFGHADLYNRAAASWPDSYSIYYFPVHSWLPMLYSPAWAHEHVPNYAWVISMAFLFILGFFSEVRLKARVSYVLVFCASIIFISGFLTPTRINEAIFHGKDLPAQTGRVVGSLRVAEPGIDSSGFVSFGPYFPLRRGKYNLTLRYSSAAAETQEIGRFDVFNASSDLVISEYPLFGTMDSLKALDVSFEVSGWRSDAYEFRSQWGGFHEIKIHEIVLRGPY